MTDLIQPGDIALALAAGGRPASAAQQSALQNACDVASGLARKICGDRDFVRQTYVERYWPTDDGLVWLRQMPVNAVTRVSAGRSPAITIQCLGSPARASVLFTLGSLAWDPPVGLTLLSVNSGVTSAVEVAFADYADIGSLGSYIAGSVSGWTASVQGWATGYPCSDLVGGDVAAMALGDGADIAAYADDIPGRLDRRTGILHLPDVGLAGPENVADPSWWPEVGGVSDDRIKRGSVLVGYDAGYDAIPPEVVAGTVLIAIALLDRWTADFTLMSEDLGNTSYQRVSPELLGAVPKAAYDYLLPKRIMRA